ncbi:multiple resistance and pH regulation protein F [Ignisphaera aggregans DSM 17230]|uniref:Multiple resistance and pH regulation protein F n=1 Tax=Ignisphaera aggregans (strain DSM 17230 / JCM 13409 / AQ1.S1) TaxID=583356 RepID=E0ST42_IGNAA|nr:multiple resistance and pH regulation protein F [Ignisphaera aggregans DSM 17230]
MSYTAHVQTFLTFVIPIYIVSMILYTIRAIKGPTLPDSVIAIDALSYVLGVLLIIFSIYLQSPILIPCAIVLMLWVYALDVYVAKYLESKEIGE